MNRKAKRKLISLAFSISVLCTACGSAVEGSANGPAGSETIPETVSAAPATNTNVSSANSERNVISVNSSETITVVPDIAEIVYAVRTEAKDAASCQQKNTEDVAKVIELLKGLGVEKPPYKLPTIICTRYTITAGIPSGLPAMKHPRL